MKQGNGTVLIKRWKFPRIVLVVILVLFLLLLGQFAYLSLSKKVYGDDLRAYAEKRMTVEEVLYAKRGTIYDNDGNMLATNVASYTLVAYLSPSRTTDSDNPMHVVDKEGTARALAEVLNADYDYILSRLKMDEINKDQYQVEFGSIGSGLTELTKIAIEELDLPGIGFVETSKRFYPNGTFASYIVGYAKKYDEEIVGELGIESKYNDILKGTDGYLMYQKDPSNFKIPDTKETRVDAINGSNIYLTIDSSIQRFAEDVVKNTVETYEPEWMILIAMDAKTGEILASATSPNFDPNSLPADMSYQNPVISYEYEPGSTMKTYTYMCAMEKGVYDGSQLFLSGNYKVGPNTINDWNLEGWGYIDYDTGYELSSNVGIINIIKNYLSPSELKACFRKYGFGDVTGIELSNEITGDIDYNEKVEIDSLTAGFGQGISTTAIQHLQALSIVANDGYMVKPHIISKIVNANGDVINIQPEVSSQAIVSKQTTDKIKELMYNTVTDDWATAHAYYLDGYDIIGKTGTAEIYENGHYLVGNGNHLLSFAGMYPKEDPKIIIYVAIKKPNVDSNYVIANGFKEFVKNTSKYLNMFNNTKELSSLNIITLNNYVNKNVNTTKALLEDEGLNVYVIGDGNTIINQYPYVNSRVLSNDKIFLKTNGENFKIANMVGWSKKDVLTYLNIIGIDYKINGYGYLINQSIEPDTLITDDMILELEFSEKVDLSNVN